MSTTELFSSPELKLAPGETELLKLIDMMAHHQRRITSFLMIAAIISGACACIPALAVATDEALIESGFYGAESASGTNETPPRVAPEVFAKTGTISIIVNDMREPQGRIYFGGFLISSILMLISQSPFWLYRPWKEGRRGRDEMSCFGQWVVAHERTLRTIGYVAPPCLLALCAIVVTPQDMTDHRFYLLSSMAHNIGFLGFGTSQMVFEMCQLHVGENYGWRRFLKNEGEADQRFRFLMEILCQINLIVFAGLSTVIRYIEPNVTLASLAVWFEVFVPGPIWLGIFVTALYNLEKTKVVQSSQWPPPMETAPSSYEPLGA